MPRSLMVDGMPPSFSLCERATQSTRPTGAASTRGARAASFSARVFFDHPRYFARHALQSCVNPPPGLANITAGAAW